MTELFCSGEEAGLAVLECLARRLPTAPPAYLRQLFRKGKIRRQGIPLTAETPVRAGDRLQLPNSERLRSLSEAPSGVEILFESGEILVANKPAGLAVHRGLGHEEDNLTDRLRNLLRERRAPYRLSPVHRLDAGTSGPVLFAKGRRAAATLGELFMTGQVEKTYVALAAGRLEGAGRLVSPVPAKGKLKLATTVFRCLELRGGHSLLELELQSGRTHQIRRQLADAGHPLAGDRRYGGPALRCLHHPFLHCCRLALNNPFDASRLEANCPLPEDLAAVLAALPATPMLELFSRGKSALQE